MSGTILTFSFPCQHFNLCQNHELHLGIKVSQVWKNHVIVKNCECVAVLAKPAAISGPTQPQPANAFLWYNQGCFNHFIQTLSYFYPSASTFFSCFQPQNGLDRSGSQWTRGKTWNVLLFALFFRLALDWTGFAISQFTLYLFFFNFVLFMFGTIFNFFNFTKQFFHDAYFLLVTSLFYCLFCLYFCSSYPSF